MQCPKCQRDNVSGHAYCAFCRAELKTGVSLAQPAESGAPAPPQPAKSSPPVWRWVRMGINALLVFVIVAIARSINWEQVKKQISSTKTGVEQPVAKPGKSERPGAEPTKHKADKPKAKS